MKYVIVFFIKIYQKIASPIQKAFFLNCKYYPNCSEYTKLAVLKYGTIKGTFLGFKRILRCNPFSSGGHDPLK